VLTRDILQINQKFTKLEAITEQWITTYTTLLSNNCQETTTITSLLSTDGQQNTTSSQVIHHWASMDQFFIHLFVCQLLPACLNQVAKVRAITRTKLLAMESGHCSYLFGVVLKKGVTLVLASFWASCVPQEILRRNFSERGKHLAHMGPLTSWHIVRLQYEMVNTEIDMQLKYTIQNPLWYPEVQIPYIEPALYLISVETFNILHLIFVGKNVAIHARGSAIFKFRLAYHCLLQPRLLIRVRFMALDSTGVQLKPQIVLENIQHQQLGPI
jgi:hypothetical protein